MGIAITLLKGSDKHYHWYREPADKDFIIMALKMNNVLVQEIWCCITTHGHINHLKNLNPFPNATSVSSSPSCVLVTCIALSISSLEMRLHWTVYRVCLYFIYCHEMRICKHYFLNFEIYIYTCIGMRRYSHMAIL